VGSLRNTFPPKVDKLQAEFVSSILTIGSKLTNQLGSFGIP
jgi:hypothetical protein